jgi:hypothetical protein
LLSAWHILPSRSKRGGRHIIQDKKMTEIHYQKQGDGAEPPTPCPGMTPTELSLTVSQQAARMHSILKSATQLFDKIDTDHSGALSVREIQAAMKTLPAKDQEILKDLLRAQRIELGGRPRPAPIDDLAGITKASLQNDAKIADDAKTATTANNKAKFISSDIISKYGHDGKLNAGDLKAALDPSSTLTSVERKVLKDLQAGLEKHPQDALSASDLETKIRRWADNKINTLFALNYEFNQDLPRAHSGRDTLALPAAVSPPPRSDRPDRPPSPGAQGADKIITDPPYWIMPPLPAPHIINLPDHTYVHKPIVLPLPPANH